MHTYSLNEAASRARLAARGAGYSWGCADEFYRTVLWLSENGYPSLPAVQLLLSQFHENENASLTIPRIEGNRYTPRGAWICPVMLGTAMVEGLQHIDVSHGVHNEFQFSTLRSPLLLLPYIAEMANKFDCVAVVQMDGFAMVTNGVSARLSSNELMSMKEVAVGALSFEEKTQHVFSEEEKFNSVSRVEVDQTCWTMLGAFAHKTYAPATEASRISGAGAGTSDND